MQILSRAITIVIFATVFFFQNALAQTEKYVEIRVVVRNQDGDAVRGARVEIWHDWSGIGLSQPLGDWSRPADYQLETNDAGIATARVLAKTTFAKQGVGERAFGRTLKIEVYRAGYSRGEDSITFSGTDIPERVIRNITLTGGELEKPKADDMTIKVQATRADTGAPLMGARVDIYLNTPFLRKHVSASTDQNGEATLITQIFNDFEIVANKTNFKESRRNITLKNTTKVAGPYVIALERHPGAEISINAIDEDSKQPIGDAEITLKGIDSYGFYTSTTDGGGNATFFVPEIGKFSIKASQTYFETYHGELRLLQGEESKQVTIRLKAKPKKAEGRDEINVTVVAEAEKGETGPPKPIASAGVKVGNTSVVTDSEGKATLTGEFDDDVEVTVSANGFKSKTKMVRIPRLTRYAGGTATIKFVLTSTGASDLTPINLVVEIRDSKTQKPLAGVSVFLRLEGKLIGESTTNSEGDAAFEIIDKDDTPLARVRTSVRLDIYRKNYLQKLSDITPDLLAPSREVRRVSVFLDRDPAALANALEALLKKVIIWHNLAKQAATSKLRPLAQKAIDAEHRVKALKNAIMKAHDAFGFGVAPGISAVSTRCKKAAELSKDLLAHSERAKSLEQTIKTTLDEGVRLANTCTSSSTADAINQKYQEAIKYLAELGSLEKTVADESNNLKALALEAEDLTSIIKEAENNLENIDKENLGVTQNYNDATQALKNAIDLGKNVLAQRGELEKERDALLNEHEVSETGLPDTLAKKLTTITDLLDSKSNDVFFLMGSKPDEKPLDTIKNSKKVINTYRGEAAEAIARFKRIICTISSETPQLADVGAMVIGSTIEVSDAANLPKRADECRKAGPCQPLLDAARNLMQQGSIEPAQSKLDEARAQKCDVSELTNELDYFKTLKEAIDFMKKLRDVCKFQEALDFAIKIPPRILEKSLMQQAVSDTRAGLDAQKRVRQRLLQAKASKDANEQQKLITEAEKTAQFYPCLLQEVTTEKRQLPSEDKANQGSGTVVNWSGTFFKKLSNGGTSIRVIGSGTSLTANEQWKDGNNSGTTTWSNCKVDGNKAKCDWTATYNDPDKSGTRKGTLEATTSGDSMSATYHEDEPQFNWRVKPYASAMRKGAVWPVTWSKKL